MLEFQLAPWKINMEPTNHPFGKENNLNQTSMIMLHLPNDLEDSGAL